MGGFCCIHSPLFKTIEFPVENHPQAQRTAASAWAETEAGSGFGFIVLDFSQLHYIKVQFIYHYPLIVKGCNPEYRFGRVCLPP